MYFDAIGDIFVDEVQQPVVRLRILLCRVTDGEGNIDGAVFDFRHWTNRTYYLLGYAGRSS